MANDLEESFRRAAETGDDAKLLRALARNEVFLAEPLLPTAVGKDGRTYVLGFASAPALERWYADTEVTWRSLRGGDLAAAWPGETPLLLAMEGRTVVLEAEDVRTVGLLAAGANVRAAFQPGPATPVGLAEPGAEPEGLFDGIRGVAGIEGVVWGLARLDEPEARVWPVVGVELAADADAAAVMPEAVRSFERASGGYVELRALQPGREPDEIDRWLRAHGRRVPLSAA